MAVSPIAPAALPVQPAEAQPAPLPDAAVLVTPAGDAQKGSATAGDGGTSGNSSDPQSSLERALQKINEQMTAWSTQMEFSIDPDTHRVVISIKDSKTGDTLKTIPSETVLNIAKMITKMQGGGVETSA